MKKFILLGIFVLTFIVQANSSFNINNENYDYDEVNAYCLGIGKVTKK